MDAINNLRTSLIRTVTKTRDSIQSSQSQESIENLTDKGEQMLSIGDNNNGTTPATPERSFRRQGTLLQRLTNKIKVIRDSSEERKNYNWFTNRSMSQGSSPERNKVTLNSMQTVTAPQLEPVEAEEIAEATVSDKKEEASGKSDFQ